MTTNQPYEELRGKVRQLLFVELSKVIVGYDSVRLAIGSALLADGHVLLESMPGLSKTTIAKCLAAGIAGATVSRIQCTSDLKPSDIVGSQILNPQSASFVWENGPVFANIVVADEINRATPKTQSALLEAMQERQVTMRNETRVLPRPFILLATENPVEQEGTFPLPEAQVDRFAIKVVLDYLDEDDELAILERSHLLGRSAESQITPQLSIQELIEAQAAVKQIGQKATRQLKSYVTRLARATRPGNKHFPAALAGSDDKANVVVAGASPRCAMSMLDIASAMVFIEGRDFIEPDDVKRVFPLVARHRITMQPFARVDGITSEEVIKAILDTVPVNG